MCVAFLLASPSVDELAEAAFASAGRILLDKKGELVFLKMSKNSDQEILQSFVRLLKINAENAARSSALVLVSQRSLSNTRRPSTALLNPLAK